MSLLESKGPSDFDWSKGASLFFVGHIPHVQTNVVLFELGERFLGPKLSVQLDAEPALAFQVTDRAHKVAAVSMPWGPILASPFLLVCELAPAAGRGEWRLSLSINGKERAQRTASLHMPTHGKIVQTVGGDLSGDRNAMFTLAEFGIVGGPMSADDNDRLLSYSVERYALKFPHG